MLSVAQAQAILRGGFSPLEAETVELDRAYGRVLATPLIASRDQPPFAASAMDGYACAPSTGDLLVVGESAAGRAFANPLGAGEAVRISTGAPVPEGAAGILIQENAVLDGNILRGAAAARADFIRPRGGDFAAGQLLLERGRLLDPIAIALAASAGVAMLDVVRRPRIAVMAGGDEIVPPGHTARADQVYESGSFAIRGLIQQWGGETERSPILPDNIGAITTAARAALQGNDLLVLIGGASVGPHDHARDALQRLGLEIRFGGVAVRPGKPTWFGEGAPGRVLGLPGNPASAVVCAYLFLRPIIEAMLGRTGAHPSPLLNAPLAAPLSANGPREAYLRAWLDASGLLHPFDDQDSSLLSVFARADALIMRPANAPASERENMASYLSLR